MCLDNILGVRHFKLSENSARSTVFYKCKFFWAYMYCVSYMYIVVSKPPTSANIFTVRPPIYSRVRQFLSLRRITRNPLSSTRGIPQVIAAGAPDPAYSPLGPRLNKRERKLVFLIAIKR